MANYSGWKQLDNISIVYSVDDNITFNKKKYKKAYIAETTNKKSIESAVNWAKGYFREKSKEPVIVKTDNKDFKFQIASAADNSWSQGGKLSFWMCVMEKDGIEPFAVGINSDLLADLILESTVYKGAVKEKVFFARKNSQLGVLHEKMPSYQALLNDQAIKQNINKGKTTKWKIGYEYNTLTTSDIMYGYFKPIAQNSYGNVWLDFDTPAKPFYTYYETIKETVTKFGWAFDRDSKSKCPSRQEGKKIFNESPTYYKDFCNDVANYYLNLKLTEKYSYEIDNVGCIRDLIKAAFNIFTYAPDKTIELLEYQKTLIQQKIDNINAGIMTNEDEWFWKDKPDMFTSNFLLYRSTFRGYGTFANLSINYNGQTFTYAEDVFGFYNKLIEIAKTEMAKL